MKNKIHIYLIEDDSFYRNLLYSLLADEPDLDLSVFASWSEFEKTQFPCPDLFILDYHLQEPNGRTVSGIEIMDALDQKTCEKPIIFLTAQKEIEVAVKLMKRGVFDYLSKENSSPQQIRKEIMTLISQIRLEKQLIQIENDYQKQRTRMSIFASLLVVLICASLIFLEIGMKTEDFNAYAKNSGTQYEQNYLELETTTTTRENWSLEQR